MIQQTYKTHNATARILLTLAFLTPLLLFLLGRFLARFDHIPGQTILVVQHAFVGFVVLTIGIAGALMWFRKRDKGSGIVSIICRRSIWICFSILLVVGLYPFSVTVSSNVLMFVLPLSVAWALMPIWNDEQEASGQNKPSRLKPDWLLITIIFTCIYWSMGVYFTETVGQHSGDEAHYITQAESLYYDGDLDLKNLLGDNQHQRRRYHISPNSRDGHWYSWHTPGLSFLLAPTVRGGIIMRHFVLGLIAGLAISGMYVLGRVWGGSRRSLLILAPLLGVGPFWAIYSSRALPEVLGAMLTVYGLIAAVSQKKYPRLSMFLCVLCISSLPWAHTRFLPIAVTLAGIFGLEVLVGNLALKQKIIRNCVFCVLVSAGLSVFQLVSLAMFVDGLAYPVPNLLFSHVSGLWHTLASGRGILFMFPLFVCAFLSMFFVLFTTKQRRPGLYALLIFLSVWLTSSATKWFAGGACLPGRFLLATIPVVVACLSVGLNKSNRTFKFLVLYLGLLPVLIYIPQLIILDQFWKSVSDPLLIDIVHPLYANLVRIFYDPFSETRLLPALHLYVIVGVLLLVPDAYKKLQVGLVVLLTVLTITSVKPQTVTAARYDPQHAAASLLDIDLERTVVFSWGESGRTESYLKHFDLLAPDWDKTNLWVTTKDLGTVRTNSVISIPHIAPNDWAERGYHWATIIAPFSLGEGQRVLHYTAENMSESEVEFCIREGSITHAVERFPGKSKIDESFSFRADNKGDLYLLMRFVESEGKLNIQRVSYAPYSERLMRNANLTF